MQERKLYPHPKHPTVMVDDELSAYYGPEWKAYNDFSRESDCGFFNIWTDDMTTWLAAIEYTWRDAHIVLERVLTLLERADVTLLTAEDIHNIM